MNQTVQIPILVEADIRYVADYTSQKATEMGFELTSAAEVALAVSEIAQNIIRYAGEGTLKLRVLNEGRILMISMIDEGPGIENLERAMKKGYSSLKTSLGVGLDVAKRSVDEFQIKTEIENGTEVTLKKFLPVSEERIEYGIVSMADENYAVNGDDYLIKEYDGDKVLLAVLDGVGEGYPAHMASMVVKEYLSNHYRLPLEELVQNCHQILEKSDVDRGVALALARIDSGFLYYLGVGDTHAYVLGEEMSYLHNHEGTIGQHYLPTLKTKKRELNEGDYVILCTDGIKSSLWLDEDQSVSAQQLANTIFNEFHKEYGDVTTFVTKYLRAL